MLTIENLHVVFNPGDVLETHALRGVNLTIQAGEFLTVIGSNGAGKSTLLGAIAGDAPAAAGSITIDGANITALPAHKRAGKLSRVFQDPLIGTCADMTIEENMALALLRGAGRRGLSSAVTAARREEFRARLSALSLNLENRMQDLVGTLSGGQRQALSLVMATLARRGGILLLDEHTAALDPRMAAFVLELTEKVYQEGELTALMVTHSMQSALAMGRRLIMLHQGKVIYDISGEELKSQTVQQLISLFSSATGHTNDTMLS